MKPLNFEESHKCFAGYLNDLFTYSPTSMTWSDRSANVLGTPPTARFGQAAASVGNFLYLTGGIALSGISAT